MTCCDRFVRLELGEAFSESPPFNLEAAYQVPPTTYRLSPPHVMGCDVLNCHPAFASSVASNC